MNNKKKLLRAVLLLITIIVTGTQKPTQATTVNDKMNNTKIADAMAKNEAEKPLLPNLKNRRM